MCLLFSDLYRNRLGLILERWGGACDSAFSNKLPGDAGALSSKVTKESELPPLKGVFGEDIPGPGKLK